MPTIPRQRGFVLAASVLLMLFISIMLGAALFRAQVQLDSADQRIAAQRAFYAAEAGIQRALFELRQETNWRPGQDGNPLLENVPLQVANSDPAVTVGTYSVDVGDAPPFSLFKSVWVKSTGVDTEGLIRRSVVARIMIDNPASFFIATSGDLHVGSGSRFDEDILGGNVFFDVNDAIVDPAEREISIDGNVLYLDEIKGNSNPSVKISGQTKKFPMVTFAGVDLERYQAVAQKGGKYVEGDFTYNGNISLKDLEAPNGIVFAKGDIHISGEIRDSMLFVAGGNIIIENNITSSPPSESQAAPQIALLAKKDAIIPANAPNDITVNAFIMADGGEGSQGGIFTAMGAKGSKGSINFHGTMALRGQGARTAADLNVYRDRNYSYNPLNRNLPLLPAIANIVYWKEINPNDPIPTGETP
jgi:hypothetical protein